MVACSAYDRSAGEGAKAVGVQPNTASKQGLLRRDLVGERLGPLVGSVQFSCEPLLPFVPRPC
jgi:hypothetical protein